MDEEKKTNPLNTLMRSTMEQVRQMADANTVVGEPIRTPDGVTLIPITRVSFGFGSGGGSYGKAAKDGFAGGGAAGVRMEPVAFLTIKDGITRILPVGMPPANTVDRIVDMAPEVIDRVENFVSGRKAKSQESAE